MHLPIQEITSKRSEQRKFGWVMGGALAALGAIRWLWRGDLPWLLLGLAAALAVLGTVAPGLLRPVFVAWLKLAEGLNWVMTRVTLSITFYLMITPTALIYRMISGDPLKRAWDRAAPTYWEEPDAQPNERDAYRNQF
ncbi:MAG: hypothetical protein AMXMBFR84_15870 [Candidatus Hydrogenedentota bacterium]